MVEYVQTLKLTRSATIPTYLAEDGITQFLSKVTSEAPSLPLPNFCQLEAGIIEGNFSKCNFFNDEGNSKVYSTFLGTTKSANAKSSNFVGIL